MPVRCARRTCCASAQSSAASTQNSLPSGSASTTQDSLALTDVDAPCAQRDEAVHLGLLIVGREVEVDAVLHDLARRAPRGTTSPGPHRRVRATRRRRRRSAPSGQPRTSAHQPASAWMSAASMQTSVNLNPMSVSQPSSFFNTLPIALRGRASTMRTSRGRLCAESCWATIVDQRLRRRGADDERHDPLAEVVVGHPDDRDLVDLRRARAAPSRSRPPRCGIRRT